MVHPISPATLVQITVISWLGYWMTVWSIPLVGPHLLKIGLGGIDRLKTNPKSPPSSQSTLQSNSDKDDDKGVKIPEATGLIPGTIYLLLLTVSTPLPFIHFFTPNNSYPLLSEEFPHQSFATYLATLQSILIALFLGFLDDLFDIRWRWKIPIPLVSSIPLLMSYYTSHGLTTIVLPLIPPLRELFDTPHGILNLGPLYYLYMTMLSIFCTNAINIIAGVNGVECIQAIIIAASLVINDLLFVSFRLDGRWISWIPGMDFVRELYWDTPRVMDSSPVLQDRHIFSLMFMVPLLAVCLGLYKYNRFPSSVFVGDTLCYFTGMTFATIAIQAHYTKTLLLFFIPQIFNFLYSCPQLFGLVPCPRHRMPVQNQGQLSISWAETSGVKFPRLIIPILQILASLSLVRLEYQGGKLTHVSNLTVLNLLLILGGECTEKQLAERFGWLQIGGSAIAFGIRYGMRSVFYEKDRL